MKVVFFGTPPFAVPTLLQLANDPAFDLALVVSQPDRPAGRGRRLEASAVALAARERGLPLYQPTSLRDAAARQPLADVAADLFVVAAYGLIFGPKTLALPRLGCINVHASLLPRYRGASPIAAAIAAGETETGVSLMRMETGLDTGPVLSQATELIASDDTTESLTSRLATLGAKLISSDLLRYAAGEGELTPQSTANATLTRPLTKADGWLDWELPAITLERRVRAMSPWPRAWTALASGIPLQVHAAAVVLSWPGAVPGMVRVTADGLIVAAGNEALALSIVQPAGGRAMPITAFLAGHPILPPILGRGGAPEKALPLDSPLR